MKVTKLSESEFEKLKIPILFREESFDRVFAVISDGKKGYKIGWQSDKIEPVAKWVSPGLCSIGVDLIFIIFEFSTGKVLKTISLDYYFYDTQISNGAIYLITQLEIIKINILDLRIVEIYALPDYFEDIQFDEKNIVVKCINNEIINIK